MPFAIDEIRASLSSLGYQKPSHFAVAIIPPDSLRNNSFGDMLARANSVNIPGVSLGVDNIRHKGFGLDEKRPTTKGFEDVGITIIADQEGKLHKALSDWMELVMPTDIEDTSAEDVEYFEYPENYYGGLEIYQYDIASNLHTTFTFVQPFITQLGSLQMSWETTDSLLIIPANFSFRTYKRNSTYSGFSSNIGVDNNQINNLF